MGAVIIRPSLARANAGRRERDAGTTLDGEVVDAARAVTRDERDARSMVIGRID